MLKTNIFVGVLAIGISLSYVYYHNIRRFLSKLSSNNRLLSSEKIEIISSDTDDIKGVADEVKAHTAELNVLGFDCEWVSDRKHRKPIALLQICTHRKLCVLIRLCKLKRVPEEFTELLEDASILKVGIVPSQDAKYMLCDYGVMVKGCLDLRFLTRIEHGLASMAKEYLNYDMDKSWRVRCSDWEAESLTTRQVTYAANDALVAVEIFKFLTVNKKIDTSDLELYLDVKYRKKCENTKRNSKVRTLDEVPTPKRPTKMCPRKNPLYTNSYMLAPDSELLCTCDRGKAEWYISKGLAELVSDDPFTIRLLFEPAGRAVGDTGEFYKTAKVNQCVVCGRTDSYIRKNVVPKEYRKLFPNIMKEHTSHDVLLLCISCHQKSNMCDLLMRYKLAKICDAPIGTDCDIKVTISKELRQLQSAARALLKNPNKLPEKRKAELSEIVLKHFPNETEVTEEILKEAQETTCRVINENYESHGQRVVEYFVKNAQSNEQSDEKLTGGLIQLERMWREHFLTSMKPQYMPELWSVAHNQYRLEIRAEEGRVEIEDLKVAGCYENFKNHMTKTC